MTIKKFKEEIINWKLSKKRIINLSIAITALLVYEFLAVPFYRPYIYSNHIYDFHIANTLSNSFGSIAIIFICIGLIGHTRIQHIFMIKAITIVIVIYELAHPLFGKPIERWDLVATICAGGFCFLLYRIIFKNENMSLLQ